MLTAALMLMQSAKAPTLGAVEALPPFLAGELALQDEPHGQIVSVEKRQQIGLGLPYTVERQLVEQASFDGRGCIRVRWTAEFVLSPGQDWNSAWLNGKRRSVEIKDSKSKKCPAGQYVQLNEALDSDWHFGALSQLRQVQSGRRKVRFNCSDETSSNICESQKVTRGELAKLVPWLLTRKRDGVLFVLGNRGGVVTTMEFDAANPSSVSVSRRVPAPS